MKGIHVYFDLSLVTVTAEVPCTLVIPPLELISNSNSTLFTPSLLFLEVKVLMLFVRLANPLMSLHSVSTFYIQRGLSA